MAADKERNIFDRIFDVAIELAEEEGLPFTREDNEHLRGVPRRESLMLILKERIYPEEKILEMMERKNSYYLAFIKEITPRDLLPGATRDQKVATGFHRNTLTNTEGGTDDEEFRSAAVIDRVNTTIQAWMGLTMGCCQCHDHPYDSITQHDYYGLFAYFNNTEDADRDDESPTMPTPTKEDKKPRRVSPDLKDPFGNRNNG